MKKLLDAIGERSLAFSKKAFKVMCWGIAIYYILFLLPSPGFAAETTPTITQDSINTAAYSYADPDLSGIGILRKIFGNLVDNPLNPAAASGLGDTALGQIFMVLNMSLLAIGSVYLAYNVSVGVAQTAQDGEFLGKRFSSMWMPIRTLTGVVSLVPVFHGFAISQLVMIYMAVGGVGIGNMAAEAVVRYQDAHGTVVNTPVTSVNRKFVVDLYEINLCVSAMNQPLSQKLYAKRITGDYANYGVSNSMDSSCGSVELPNSKIAAAQHASLAAFTKLDDTIRAHTDHLVAQIAESFDPANNVKSLAVLSDLDIAGYADAYQNDLRQQLAAALNTQTHISNEISQYGFVGLGLYYAKLAGAQNAKNEAAQTQAVIIKKPQMTESQRASLGVIYNFALNVIDGHRDAALSTMESLKVPPSDGGFLISELKKQTQQTIPVSGCNNAPDNSWFSGQGMLALAINATGCDPSPLNRMKTVGDYLVAIGMAGYAVGAAAHGLSSVPLVGPAVDSFVTMFQSLMSMLIFFALMLSTYLPLIPFVAWIGALISWVVVVIEGVVAAPLWAFAHLDSDGEGMGQKAQHGYFFSLNVLLRPVLMVTGFLASIIVVTVIGSVFSKMYLLAVADANADSMVGLLMLIVFIGVFATTSVMIVSTSVGLIHTLPDVVLNWIAESTGSTGGGAAMSSNFGASATGVTGAGGSIVQQSMNKVRGKMAGKGGGSGGSEGGGKARSSRTGGDPFAGATNAKMEWHRSNDTSAV